MKLLIKDCMRNILRSKNTLIFGLLFFGFFLIFPQRGNFGDDANMYLMFQSNIIEYVESENKEPFFEYLKNKHSEFHKDHLADPEEKNHYKLFGMYGLLTAPVQDFNVSMVLSRVIEFTLYHVFLKKLDIEQCIVLYIFIIFLATFVYAFKFGSELLNKNFGIILAVIVVSNIYYAQLNRTFLLSHIAVYPLLFLMSFYYLFSLHNSKNKKKGPLIVGLSIAFALAFLNGYPNTNFVLIGLLGTFFTFLVLFPGLNENKYKLINIKNYVYIFILAVILVLLISGIWSILLGYDFFYALKVIFRTRTWGMVLEGNAVSYSVIADYNAKYLFEKISALLRLLFTESNYIIGPHEPSFLLHLNFLNYFEKVFLLAGVLFWIKNIRNKNLVNLFLSFVFIFFWIRGISHKSVGHIGRTEFDYIFCVLFFVAYGCYSIFQHFIKFYPDSSKISNRLFQPEMALYSFLMVEIVLNSFIFNYYYVYKYNESLGLHNGAYQLRKLYRNEIANKNNFIVLDFMQPGYYKYHIDNISLLQGDINYFSIEKFIEEYKDPERFIDFLRENSNSSYYFIFPNNVETVAKAKYRNDIRASIARLYKHISLYDYYKVIKDRRGIPIYYVWKISFDNSFNYLTLNDKQSTYVINLEDDEALKFLDFPSNVKAVSLESAETTLNLDFSKTYFKKFHYSFDDKSIVEVFNNFDSDDKFSNIINNEAQVVHEQQHNYYGVRVDMLEAAGSAANVDFQYNFGVPINSIYLNVPFLFFNDKNLFNSFSVLMKNNQKEPWSKIYQKISNGTMLISDHKQFELFDIFAKQYSMSLGPHTINTFNGLVDGGSSSQIFIRYQIKNYKKSVRPLTMTWHEESSPNQLIFNVDTSQQKDFLSLVNHVGRLKLTFEFKENVKPKYSDLARDNILGYGLVRK